MRFENKRVLITGGTNGIGRALAVSLHNRDAKVAVCGRHTERLEEMQREYPRITGLRADVTDPGDVVSLKQQLDGTMGGLDILVNNAGRMVQFDAREEIPADADREVALNLIAPLHLIRLFLPQLLQRQEAAIVNISSGYALWPSRSAPVYSATKAAIHALSKSLRWQLQDTPVRMIEVLPPLVRTASAVVSRGGMTPEAFAKAVVHRMESGNEEIALAGVRLLKLGARCCPRIVDRVLKNR